MGNDVSQSKHSKQRVSNLLNSVATVSEESDPKDIQQSLLDLLKHVFTVDQFGSADLRIMFMAKLFKTQIYANMLATFSDLKPSSLKFAFHAADVLRALYKYEVPPEIIDLRGPAALLQCLPQLALGSVDFAQGHHNQWKKTCKLVIGALDNLMRHSSGAVEKLGDQEMSWKSIFTIIGRLQQKRPFRSCSYYHSNLLNRPHKRLKDAGVLQEMCSSRSAFPWLLNGLASCDDTHRVRPKLVALAVTELIRVLRTTRKESILLGSIAAAATILCQPYLISSDLRSALFRSILPQSILSRRSSQALAQQSLSTSIILLTAARTPRGCGDTISMDMEDFIFCTLHVIKARDGLYIDAKIWMSHILDQLEYLPFAVRTPHFLYCYQKVLLEASSWHSSFLKAFPIILEIGKQMASVTKMSNFSDDVTAENPIFDYFYARKELFDRPAFRNNMFRILNNSPFLPNQLVE